MQQKKRYQQILAWFAANVPVAKSELRYKNAFELTVATMLAAQCTDKRVNMVTPALLHDYPTPEALAQATPEVIFEYIKTVSYPNNKAKHLVGMAQMLVKDFGGKVPGEVPDLEKLPGVGRKTANVVASIIFNKPVMAVDTHVFRVSARLGLTTNARAPLETERELEANIPTHLIAKAHHWLILHGRYVCTARKPKCGECGIRAWCRYDEELKNTSKT